jgi:hypothetical protein
MKSISDMSGILIYGIDYDDTCLHGGHRATQTTFAKGRFWPLWKALHNGPLCIARDYV